MLQEEAFQWNATYEHSGFFLHKAIIIVIMLQNQSVRLGDINGNKDQFHDKYEYNKSSL